MSVVGRSELGTSRKFAAKVEFNVSVESMEAVVLVVGTVVLYCERRCSRI